MPNKTKVLHLPITLSSNVIPTIITTFIYLKMLFSYALIYYKESVYREYSRKENWLVSKGITKQAIQSVMLV